MNAEQRLLCQDILERIQQIESVISAGHDAYLHSRTLQDSVILSFIVIGEAAKNLDAALTQTHPQIPWKSVTGFRDILVHQYRRTRLELVWRASQEDLPALKAAITSIIASLDEPPPTSD